MQEEGGSDRRSGRGGEAFGLGHTGAARGGRGPSREGAGSSRGSVGNRSNRPPETWDEVQAYNVKRQREVSRQQAQHHKEVRDDISQALEVGPRTTGARRSLDPHFAQAESRHEGSEMRNLFYELTGEEVDLFEHEPEQGADRDLRIALKRATCEADSTQAQEDGEYVERSCAAPEGGQRWEGGLLGRGQGLRGRGLCLRAREESFFIRDEPPGVQPELSGVDSQPRRRVPGGASSRGARLALVARQLPPG